MSTRTLRFDVGNFLPWLTGLIIVIFTIFALHNFYESYDSDEYYSWDGFITTAQSESFIQNYIIETPLNLEETTIINATIDDINNFPISQDFDEWGEYLSDVISPTLEKAYKSLTKIGKFTKQDVECLIGIGTSMKFFEQIFKDKEYEMDESLIDVYITIKEVYEEMEKFIKK